jgi:Ran GTPase-activating protein (RanGAP) involved in mRNA processing and transport
MAINSDTLSRLERNDSTLTSLNLSNQALKATDIKTLVKALERNTFLYELDLSGNSIGDKGAKLLLACKGLRTLKLDATQISEKGAMALAQHPTVTTLHLS